MSDIDEHHIYKVPRSVIGPSYITHPPSPPLSVRIPSQQPTASTNTMAYSHSFPAQQACIDTPPLPPPRNRSMSEHSTPVIPHEQRHIVLSPPIHETSTFPVITQTKRWFSSQKPFKFSSFREKRNIPVLPVRGVWSQYKRRCSDDLVDTANGANTFSSRAEDRPLEQFDLSPTESDKSFQSLPPTRLSLGQLVDGYAHSFPYRIKAKQSYIFQASHLSIFNSNMYNLYFIKQQQVIIMLDQEGTAYTIPINSAVQFGYINPSNGIIRPKFSSLAYKSFAKVSDILALSPAEIPKVVCALKKFKGQSKKSSVEPNEVLLILQIRRNKLTGKRFIKAYSFLTKFRKDLLADCDAQFTTNPSHLRLWLTDLTEAAPDLFPCHAVIYFEERFTSSLRHFPSPLLEQDAYVTLTDLKVQKTIVASLVTEFQSSNLSSQSLLDIPVSASLANLQIEIVASSQNNEILNAEAKRMYEELDIACIQSLQDSATDRSYATQCLFHTILQSGAEKAGMVVIPPVAVNHHQMAGETLSLVEEPAWDQDSDSEIEHYQKLRNGTPDLQSEASLMPVLENHSTSSASPSTSSISHPLYAPLRVNYMNCHSESFSNGLSPKDKWGHHADELQHYEIMQSPVPAESNHSMESTQSDIVSELRTAVQLLEDRVGMVEKKSNQYRELKSMMQTLSSRVGRLEKLLMSQPSSDEQNRHDPVPPKPSNSNLSYLRSLNTLQVKKYS